ncbi:hypothetical protein Tco_0116402 [Tanacetum coccineum]
MAESAKRHEENSNIIKEIRTSTDAAIRNQGASIKTLEIQIGQMSKVLQERGIGGLPGSTEPNPKDHVKSISTTKADSSEIRCMGCSSYVVSGSQHRSIFSKIVPFPRRLQTTSVMIGESFYYSIIKDKDDHEGKSPAGAVIDIPVFVGKFSVLIGFIIIDDEDVTRDVVLGMPFFMKYVSCQMIMKKFTHGDKCERIMDK